MPEVKRVFQAGKMNKDLDERLVPNGEYRDALNIEVGTSEGGDVGTVQTIAGNSRVTTLGIAGQKCIGAFVNYATDKVYWFIKGTSIDAIAEWDPTTETLHPVLVDTQGVMQFSVYWRMNGINMIDDLMFFTDGAKEPKVINIETFKHGTTSFSHHTKVKNQAGTLVDFTEEDVVVIKKAPLTPPTLTMSDTKRSGPVSTTFSQMGSPIVNNSFTMTDSNGDIVPVPTTTNPFNITVNSNSMDWQVGDQLLVSISGGSVDLAEVRLRIVQTYTTSPNVFKVTIDSISEEIEQGMQTWEIILVEDKPMFEFKFPRFAYRWKHRDGTHSPMGPFSEVAFIPDEYDYQTKKGFNIGMKNNLRSLKISDFVTSDIPKDAIEIDILYKEDGINNIYTVKSVKCAPGNHDQEYTNDELEITSEIIYATVPSNQLLRPYDNVPRRARAQEITGNRLVYGNYTQQYFVTNNGQEITPKFNVTIGQDNSNAVDIREPGKSLKSIRTYQVGVVYRDKYGRETPVLTDQTGSLTLDKSASANYNKMSVKINTGIPWFAESYKYFIKETSNEYYNVAMDRHYAAEDGNVWISFPSSERNKVQEGKFLILKKEHNGDTPVTEEARYKVLAVENEAPDYLKIDHVSQGVLNAKDDGDLFLSDGYPSSDFGHFSIAADEWETMYGSANPNANNNNVNMSLHTKSDLLVRVFSGNRSTDRYEVASIQYQPADSAGNYADGTPVGDDAVYRVELEKKFLAADSDWLGSVSGNDSLNDLSVEFFQKKIKRKPEFQGRFFAKINKDSVLQEAILDRSDGDNFKILYSLNLWQHETNSRTKSYWRDTRKGTGDYDSYGSGWYIDKTKLRHYADAGGTGDKRSTWTGSGSNAHTVNGKGFTSGETKVELAYHWWGDTDRHAWQGRWRNFENNEKPQYKAIVDLLETPGTQIRFPDDPNLTVYTVKKWRRNHGTGFKKGRIGRWGSMRIIRWTLDLDKPLEWTPESETGTQNGTNYANFGGNSNGTKANYRTEIDFLETWNQGDDNIQDGGGYSKDPAIFETEPMEDLGLDIYYEASEAYDKSVHGNQQDLEYFNCYSFGNGVESNRIRDDFNAPTIAKGVKASSVLDSKYEEEDKTSTLIFSGLYNSNSSTNQLNQFIMAEAITKDLDPSYGSIQKLHARDTNLITLCEDKCLRMLADKDAIYNADGSANVVTQNKFLGQAVPYIGEYGISMQPESFANYGYQAYFTDKARGAVIRLSQDGITPISDHGMKDYFADKLNTNNLDYMIGSYDNEKRLYNLTILDSRYKEDFNEDTGNRTLSFMEAVRGWTSRKSFIPEAGVSLNNKYYTFKDGDMWLHGSTTKSTFYGNFEEPSLKIIFNDSPDVVKTFKTLNYEGTQSFITKNTTDNRYDNNYTKYGWYNSYTKTNLQDGKVLEFIDKEDKWFSYIQGDATTIKNVDSQEFSVQGIGSGTVTNDTGGFTEITLTIQENND